MLIGCGTVISPPITDLLCRLYCFFNLNRFLISSIMASFPSSTNVFNPRFSAKSDIELIFDNTHSRYVVLDCGGGTVDVTVHEMDAHTGCLKELMKASGGPYGSVAVDLAFENLLKQIFTAEFIEQYKLKRPAGWVDLLTAFESRKRSASPNKEMNINVSIPFSFFDYYRRVRNQSVESAIKKFDSKDVRWSHEGRN